AVGNLYERQDAVQALFKPPEGFDPQATPGGPQQPTPPDDIVTGDFFNYLDNDFWTSFSGDYGMEFQSIINGVVSPYPYASGGAGE
ncbi:hypothetical protein LTR53_014521, partial [Teratosphaeriaceae sp. CCFEE 6253]